MDVPLEILILRDAFCLRHDGLVAAHLYSPSLMKREGTEIASSETAAVADQGKPDLRDRRHTALCLVGRMIRSLIRKRIDIVHLLH